VAGRQRQAAGQRPAQEQRRAQGQRRAQQQRRANQQRRALEQRLTGDLTRPVGLTPRSSGGLSGYERVLRRAGLAPVAGVDEAGRGACAGPLVVAAVMLKPSKIAKLTELADSKALTAKARNAAYSQIMDAALDWSVVTIPAGEIDRLGLHVCNVAGMRRALAGLSSKPGYVLTDGFPVRGLSAPALAMWKGDQVAACVAAASVIAKVTRDAMMCELDKAYPGYGFSRHKGYSTRGHMGQLDQHGPCPEHRMSFVNVKGRMPVDLPADAAEAVDLASAADLASGLDPGYDVEPGYAVDPGSEVESGNEVDPGNSGTANSCYPSGSGQNGPIVDVIDEHGWPTAGPAAMARGA
jgi:ribonuclease HII